MGDGGGSKQHMHLAVPTLPGFVHEQRRCVTLRQADGFRWKSLVC